MILTSIIVLFGLAQTWALGRGQEKPKKVRA